MQPESASVFFLSLNIEASRDFFIRHLGLAALQIAHTISRRKLNHNNYPLKLENVLAFGTILANAALFSAVDCHTGSM